MGYWKGKPFYEVVRWGKRDTVREFDNREDAVAYYNKLRYNNKTYGKIVLLYKYPTKTGWGMETLYQCEGEGRLL